MHRPPSPVPDQTPPFDGVITLDRGGDQIVGGMRLLERAAFTLVRGGCRRLLMVGERPAGPLRLPAVPVEWNPNAAVWLAEATPVIIIMAATTVTDPTTIAALAATAAPACVAAPRPAVLWRTEPSHLTRCLVNTGATLAPPPEVQAWKPAADALLCNANDAPGRTAAARKLYERLGRPGDGWFTRLVDRRFSQAITRILIPTGVSPNHVTLSSIAIGILGGWCFAQGTPTAAIAGALFFLLSTIIDGCDGEIARLTFRESPLGARLDILGDNLVHLFLFGGIATGLYRQRADPAIAALGMALVVGVLFAMATVYACVVRRDPNPAQQKLFEAFASREFAYLLVVLTLAGRLDWFLWLSAVGTYLFSIGLMLLGRRPSPS